MSTPPPPELVHSERRGGTVVLTLDSPPVNVLSRPVIEALSSRLSEAEADPEARVVVIRSAFEKAFAAGADIREMAGLDADRARVHGGRGQALTRRIERLPLPVIAAVRGVALGGGCELCLACDFIIASEDAQFGQPEINLGVMPGWGGTRRLPRRIGASRARRWIMTGRSVPASEAFAQGLVDRLVPPAEVVPAALALADELATKPPIALAAAKYAVLGAIDPAIDLGLAYELDLWARLFGTEGQREGMRAFLEKRPPPPPTPRKDWETVSVGLPWETDVTRRSKGKRNKAETKTRD
ncbi:MAG TPA: enoyl-CoA hydratase/isomerase family protein [Thermoplasmata archaeon]|nr:enoyl-CoA hydratase/isomerase family protein [Thermoplasmata archaeon]